MNTDTNIKRLRIINGHVDVLCMKYINQRRQIACGIVDGSVNIFNAKTLKHEFTLVDSESSTINNAVTCVVPSTLANNLIACTYAGGLIKIWDYNHNASVCSIREKRQLYGLVFHPKRPKFFTFGDDGTISLYDAETRIKETTYEKSERATLDGHVSKIFSLRFNPAYPNEFATAGWDGTLYIWDVRVQSAIRHISDIFMGGDGIIMTKDGHEIITCEWKRTDQLKVWDYKSCKLIHAIKPNMEDSRLYCGCLVNPNVLAVGGSDENLFCLIDLRSNSIMSYMKGLPHGIFCMDIADTKKEKSSKKDKMNYTCDEFADIPTIAFVSGKNLYELDYN